MDSQIGTSIIRSAECQDGTYKLAIRREERTREVKPLLYIGRHASLLEHSSHLLCNTHCGKVSTYLQVYFE